MKPIFWKNLQFGHIWPRNRWNLVVFLQCAGAVSVFLFSFGFWYLGDVSSAAIMSSSGLKCVYNFLSSKFLKTIRFTVPSIKLQFFMALKNSSQTLYCNCIKALVKLSLDNSGVSYSIDMNQVLFIFNCWWNSLSALRSLLFICSLSKGFFMSSVATKKELPKSLFNVFSTDA